MRRKFWIGIIALLIIFPTNVVSKNYENNNCVIISNVIENINMADYKQFHLNYKVFDDEIDVEKECNNIFGGNFGKILKQILDIIKFFVPILIIGLGVVDFLKAISAQNQDELKKAANKLVKRLLIGFLIFVLPTILEFLLELAGIEFGVCTLG